MRHRRRGHRGFARRIKRRTGVFSRIGRRALSFFRRHRRIRRIKRRRSSRGRIF